MEVLNISGCDPTLCGVMWRSVNVDGIERMESPMQGLPFFASESGAPRFQNLVCRPWCNHTGCSADELNFDLKSRSHSATRFLSLCVVLKLSASGCLLRSTDDCSPRIITIGGIFAAR